jgi:hypothetical protein
VRMAHSLPDLPYGYADLMPAVSPEIMELHHSKHHQVSPSHVTSAPCFLATPAIHCGQRNMPRTLVGQEQPKEQMRGGWCCALDCLTGS